MYESRLMHTEGLDGCTWHLAWRSLNINSLAAELRYERLVSGPNPDLGGAESSGDSGNTGLVGCFSFVVGVLEKGAPKSLRSLGSDGSVSLRSMLWSPKPLRGEANIARSFSGGIGGGRGGILSVSSLVGELLVLLSPLESLPERLLPLESLPKRLPPLESLPKRLPPLECCQNGCYRCS